MKSDSQSTFSALVTSLQRLGLPLSDGHSVERVNERSHDGIFVLQNATGTPYLFAAHDTAGESELRDVLTASKIVSSALVLSIDGSIKMVLRKNFRTGDIDVTAGFEKPKSPQGAFQFLARSDMDGGRGLSALTSKLENVLFEVHSAMRDIDGLHAPDALDEICKLLYAKLFDEENAVRTRSYRFQRAIYCTVEECAASIRKLYYDAIADDAAVFSNRIPAYSRSRGVFRDPVTLSSQAIAKIVSIIEPYSFSNSPVDIKGRAFQNVLIPATRAGMGQYFTPKSVITLCIDLLAPTVRDIIVDPFCGSGHFLTASLDYVRAAGGYSEKQFHDFAFTRLHGLEKSDRMVRVAMTDMRLHGDGHSNIRCVDSLLPFVNYADLFPESFDIVATNPPFGVDLPWDALSELGPFDILTSRRNESSSASLEIVAIDRCISLLRPGGRMAIILPDGILSNRNTAYVRDWIKQKAVIRAIISLPVESFAPFGANIKTSILIVRKYESGEIRKKDHNIFLAEVESIGHDASGRQISCDDFGYMAAKFADFIGSEGW